MPTQIELVINANDKAGNTTTKRLILTTPDNFDVTVTNTYISFESTIGNHKFACWYTLSDSKWTLCDWTYDDSLWSKVSMPSDTYVKVLAYGNNTFADPVYHWTGSASTTAKDYLFDGNNGILVSSDQPVFVHTLVTSYPYEECKDWDLKRWLHRRKSINDTILDFSSSSTGPSFYEIDVSSLEKDECYCIVVHFADGTIRKSAVKIK